MKKQPIVFVLLFIPLVLQAQFEQKLSLNFSPGIFKTFGKRVGTYDPMQMPNYGVGLNFNLGIQYNINSHFSLVADIGFMYTGNWSYKVGDNFDYSHFSIVDTLTGNTLAEGYNKLNCTNFEFGIIPKYYLFPGKKINLYLYAGVYMNSTKARYRDNNWYTMRDLNLLSPLDTSPYNPYLEKNFGIGFNPGIGLEFKTSALLNLSLQAGYYFIKLNKNNFKTSAQAENFNAFLFQVGLNFNLIKSKDL